MAALSQQAVESAVDAYLQHDLGLCMYVRQNETAIGQHINLPAAACSQNSECSDLLTYASSLFLSFCGRKGRKLERGKSLLSLHALLVAWPESARPRRCCCDARTAGVGKS